MMEEKDKEKNLDHYLEELFKEEEEEEEEEISMEEVEEILSFAKEDPLEEELRKAIEEGNIQRIDEVMLKILAKVEDLIIRIAKEMAGGQNA